MAPESTSELSENHRSNSTCMRARVWRWSSMARSSPHAAMSTPEGISLAHSMMYSPWYPPSGTGSPAWRAASDAANSAICVPRSFR